LDYWIRVEMATYLNGSGMIWMALSGFDWIWGGFGWILLDLGADSCGFPSWIKSFMEGFRRINLDGFSLI